ncbi:MAG: hypothetical protein GXP27_01550 [Planctomycetes bacterium]|nr:hypothetical protein [Planctomycetota bacterium]
MAETSYQPVLHIRFEGESFDVPLAELDVGPISSDQAVKRAVAVYLDVPVSKFEHYVVDRHQTGNLTIRPQAVFG